MKRKAISFLCVMAMAASLLAGCGGTSEQKAPAESSSEKVTGTEEGTDEAAKAEDGSSAAEGLDYVELDWYLTSFGQPNDVDIIQAALDEYFLEKLNCKVNLKMYTNSDYAETMPTKLMSGEPMDIVYINQSTPYNTYVAMNAFYPLDTLWDEYGTNVKGLFKEGVWDSLKYDGHVYCVPTEKDNCYIMGYIYNETLADELGLDMENTGWKSFLDVEEVLTEAMKLRDEKFPEYKGKPLFAWPTDLAPHNFALEQFVNGNLLAVCNIPGKEAQGAAGMGKDTVFNFYETDEFREYCLMKKRLVDAGVYAYDWSLFEGNLSQEASTLIVPSWGYTWIEDNLFFGDDCTSKLVIFDDTWTDSGNFTTCANTIGANCKDPERAMMVLDLVNSDPYLATLFRFGVEGEHWEYDQDGKMQLANRNADISNPGWIDWYGVGYGNLTIVNAPESYSGPDNIALTTMAKCNDEAILAEHMGFILDASNIENEIAACANVVSEYGYLLDGKVKSADEVNKAVDEFIGKLKANGSEKIVQEVQTQLDEWIANR